jgi:hypothetical protein
MQYGDVRSWGCVLPAAAIPEQACVAAACSGPVVPDFTMRSCLKCHPGCTVCTAAGCMHEPWCLTPIVQTGMSGLFRSLHLPPASLQAQGRSPAAHAACAAGASEAARHTTSSADSERIMLQREIERIQKQVGVATKEVFIRHGLAACNAKYSAKTQHSSWAAPTRSTRPLTARSPRGLVAHPPGLMRVACLRHHYVSNCVFTCLPYVYPTWLPVVPPS